MVSNVQLFDFPGVAATLLFIIETLYKAYQLYTNNGGGRMLSEPEPETASGILSLLTYFPNLIEFT